MLENVTIISLFVFIGSFIATFIFCDPIFDTEGTSTWPIKLCISSLVVFVVCFCLLPDKYKERTQDYLCVLCNKTFQLKNSDKPHVVNVSPDSSVYVCESCFNTKVKRSDADGIKEQDAENK